MDEGIRQAAAYARRFRLTIVSRDGRTSILYYPNYKEWIRAVESYIEVFGEATYHNASKNYDVEKFSFRCPVSRDLYLFLRNDYAK